jgi:lipopolysaccharide/colanic/teichoic acid biosynthesis glycosyltransferase
MLDLILGLSFLICSIPILVILIPIIYFFIDKSIFFTQERIGKHGLVFSIYKLKTMNDQTDGYGNLLPDMERTNRLGIWIRSWSLDEIPQLYNVIIGNMSIIGPRPLLVPYLHLYSEEQQKRHWVKPGITGLAQIKGRNSLDWKTSLKYDSWYANHYSLGVDLYILRQTINIVLNRSNINANPNETRSPFVGN